MENVEKLEERAIDCAIQANWKGAIDFNNQIIALTPDSMNAHLRLGYAQMQLNNLKHAKKEFKKVLELQPKNNIAEEHLEKIAILTEKKKKRHENSTKYDPDLFIDIPGKTRTIHLVNLGKKEDLAGINIGAEVVMKEKRRKMEIRTKHDEYLGSLPDDISKRLSYFINEGSTYEAYIKEIDLAAVVIFIREVTKGKKVRQYPSFPSNPHVMLSDINQIENDDDEGTEKSEEDDGEDEEVEGDLELDDDDWEDFEEEKDLQTIVQLEDEEEEEE
ncbi:tetratricopeptide repeat protein [Candidatus Woesebacteria bacterium]|nr:tetratricopeptide repeat protein [Candidatus Woesebacteria bacterium]